MRARAAPGRFEWSRESSVLVTAAKRRFARRSNIWSRDARRAAAVSPLEHQGARICWFFDRTWTPGVFGWSRGADALFAPEARGRDFRRASAVLVRRAKRRLRLGAPGGAKLLFFGCARLPGVSNGRAKLRFWQPPRIGGFLVARIEEPRLALRLLCLGARSGGFASRIRPREIAGWRARVAPGSFEWPSKAAVLVTAAMRRSARRSKRWGRDAHRAAAV